MARTPSLFDSAAPLNNCEATARYLGVSRGLVYEQARTGALPSIRIGYRLMIRTAALLELLGTDGSTGAAPDARADRHQPDRSSPVRRFTHTEGPWWVEKYARREDAGGGYGFDIQAGAGGTVVTRVVPGSTTGFGTSDWIAPVCEANARLIAEAPAMFDALLDLLMARKQSPELLCRASHQPDVQRVLDRVEEIAVSEGLVEPD